MELGFIGLGSMGSAMARNLAKAGHEVRAWNRSHVAPDAIPGVTLLGSPQEAFQADAVFTMLSVLSAGAQPIPTQFFDGVRLCFRL